MVTFGRNGGCRIVLETKCLILGCLVSAQGNTGFGLV